ncbi:hypothetical protein OQA88_9447 [Cercophora sp. LCS_1]
MASIIHDRAHHGCEDDCRHGILSEAIEDQAVDVRSEALTTHLTAYLKRTVATQGSITLPAAKRSRPDTPSGERQDQSPSAGDPDVVVSDYGEYGDTYDMDYDISSIEDDGVDSGDGGINGNVLSEEDYAIFLNGLFR